MRGRRSTSEDASEIKAKTDALQAAFHKVSEQIYQQAAERAGRGLGRRRLAATAPATEEEVVDAEVVDDEKTS